MCGIVGSALLSTNGFYAKEIQVFESLLYMDTLRGDDSTGVGLLNNDGSGTVLKEALPGYWFLSQPEFSELTKEALKDGKCMIGHNRKKTIGKVEDATAHPFVIDNRYVFVHNGTLQNHKALFDTEVDSEALGMHLTRCEGDKAKLEEALSNVQGAYACAWFDKQKMKLYLLRNKDRPLCYAKTTQGIHFASEFGMLLAATSREGLKLEDTEVVPENTLIEISLTKDENCTITKTELVFTKKAQSTVVHTSTHRGHGKMGSTKSKKGMNTTVVKEEGVSKNAYKRFRHSIKLGTKIEFWLDDVLPVASDPTGARAMFVGQSLELDIKHIVKGIYKGDITQLKNHEGGICAGTIFEVEYSKDKRFVELLVNNMVMKEYEKVVH